MFRRRTTLDKFQDFLVSAIPGRGSLFRRRRAGAARSRPGVRRKWAALATRAGRVFLRRSPLEMRPALIRSEDVGCGRRGACWGSAPPMRHRRAPGQRDPGASAAGVDAHRDQAPMRVPGRRWGNQQGSVRCAWKIHRRTEPGSVAQRRSHSSAFLWDPEARAAENRILTGPGRAVRPRARRQRARLLPSMKRPMRRKPRQTEYGWRGFAFAAARF